jgi:hypothetical protein
VCAILACYCCDVSFSSFFVRSRRCAVVLSMHSASRLSGARLPSWYGMPASGQQMACRRLSQNADLTGVRAVPTSPSRPRKARRLWPSATRFSATVHTEAQRSARAHPLISATSSSYNRRRCRRCTAVLMGASPLHTLTHLAAHYARSRPLAGTPGLLFGRHTLIWTLAGSR